MTELFRVNSLSYLKKEFEADSKYSKNRIKFYAKISKFGSRDKPPFYGMSMVHGDSQKRNEKERFKSSTIDMGYLAKERSRKIRGFNFEQTTGRAEGKVCGSFQPEINLTVKWGRKAENLDYITKKKHYSYDIKKAPPRRKHFYTKFYNVATFSDETSKKNEVPRRMLRSVSLPLLHDSIKAKVDGRVSGRGNYVPGYKPEISTTLPLDIGHEKWSRAMKKRERRNISFKCQSGRENNSMGWMKKVTYENCSSFEDNPEWPQLKLKYLKPRVKGNTRWQKGRNPRSAPSQRRTSYNTYLDYEVKPALPKVPRAFFIGRKKDTVEGLVQHVDIVCREFDKKNKLMQKMLRRSGMLKYKKKRRHRRRKKSQVVHVV